MDIITFDIIGTSGLLMHNALGMMKTDTDDVRGRKIPTPEAEAEAATYRLPSGTLYVPAVAFRSALIDGAVGFMMKRQSVPKIIATTVFTLEEFEFCPLIFPETGQPITEYLIDTRRAVIQGAGIMRSRPLIRNWATQVTFEYDPVMRTTEQLHSYLNIAGHRVGIGDFRPRPPKWAKGQGGPFGRFEAEIAEVGER